MSGRVDFLDGLRAVATVAVLLQHYLELVAHETFLPFLRLAPGLFGVVLFFCISGYVIPFSVKNGLRPLAFMTRRVFRIFPLFVGVLTGVVGLGLLGIAPFEGRLLGLTGFDYLANYLLIFEYVGAPGVLGVAWTLSVEFAWYGVFLVYFALFGHRSVLQASMVFSAAMIALALLCVLLDERMPLGRIGMIGAAFLGYVFCCWHMRLIAGQGVVLAVVAFGFATGMSQWVSFGYFDHPFMSLFNGMAAWLLALGLFCGVAASERLRTSVVWASPVAGLLGRLSFSIYLVHMPVILLLQNVLSGTALAIAATALTLLLSEATYRLIEVPGNGLGKRLMWRARHA